MRTWGTYFDCSAAQGDQRRCSAFCGRRRTRQLSSPFGAWTTSQEQVVAYLVWRFSTSHQLESTPIRTSPINRHSLWLPPDQTSKIEKDMSCSLLGAARAKFPQVPTYLC